MSVAPSDQRAPAVGVAMVTGASSGIGASFARQLAAQRRDLVLVARDEARLEGLAQDLRSWFGVGVEVLAADLTSEGGLATVEERLSASTDPVSLLINNAGFGAYGPFESSAMDLQTAMIALNITAVLRLTRAVLPGMRARGGGEILNVSSVAGFIPRSNAANYAATKAWVTSFSESLARGQREAGITVSVVCPGFTRTEFHQRASVDISRTSRLMWLDPDRVAQTALDDLRRGRVVSVPGVQYRAMIGLARVLPRRLVAALVGGR
jgi:short-subunit dehydrogenase